MPTALKSWNSGYELGIQGSVVIGRGRLCLGVDADMVVPGEGGCRDSLVINRMIEDWRTACPGAGVVSWRSWRVRELDPRLDVWGCRRQGVP